MSLFVTLAASGSGCSYRHLKEQAAPAQGASCAQTTPYGFAQIKQQVLQARCIGCHAKYDDYGKAFAEREQIRSAVFVTRSMPKRGAPLDDTQLSALKSWLDGCAPEAPTAAALTGEDSGSKTDEPAPTPVPDSQWAEVRDKVFVPNCVFCHEDFSKHETVKANATLILQRVLVDQDMPPADAEQPPLTAEQKLLFVDWVNAKMPAGTDHK